jgi:hypothetical protein
LIKLTIGSGTPLETEGEIVIEHGCVMLYHHKPKEKKKVGLGETPYTMELICGYCLHPGETIRKVGEGVYDVQL